MTHLPRGGTPVASVRHLKMKNFLNPACSSSRAGRSEIRILRYFQRHDHLPRRFVGFRSSGVHHPARHRLTRFALNKGVGWQLNLGSAYSRACGVNRGSVLFYAFETMARRPRTLTAPHRISPGFCGGSSRRMYVIRIFLIPGENFSAVNGEEYGRESVVTCWPWLRGLTMIGSLHWCLGG